MKCIYCSLKITQVSSTNGRHYLCLDCGRLGWQFVYLNEQWGLARNLNHARFVEQTAYLRQQRQQLLQQLDAYERAIRAYAKEYSTPELVGWHPLPKRG